MKGNAVVAAKLIVCCWFTSLFDGKPPYVKHICLKHTKLRLLAMVILRLVIVSDCFARKSVSIYPRHAMNDMLSCRQCVFSSFHGVIYYRLDG